VAVGGVLDDTEAHDGLRVLAAAPAHHLGFVLLHRVEGARHSLLGGGASQRGHLRTN
jgi:hypothetical protein